MGFGSSGPRPHLSMLSPQHGAREQLPFLMVPALWFFLEKYFRYPGLFQKWGMKDRASRPCVSREVCTAYFFVGVKNTPRGAVALRHSQGHVRIAACGDDASCSCALLSLHSLTPGCLLCKLERCQNNSAYDAMVLTHLPPWLSRPSKASWKF